MKRLPMITQEISGKAENLTQIFSFQGQFVGIILLLFLKGKKQTTPQSPDSSYLVFLRAQYFSDKFVKLN